MLADNCTGGRAPCGEVTASTCRCVHVLADNCTGDGGPVSMCLLIIVQVMEALVGKLLPPHAGVSMCLLVAESLLEDGNGFIVIHVIKVIQPLPHKLCLQREISSI